MHTRVWNVLLHIKTLASYFALFLPQCPLSQTGISEVSTSQDGCEIRGVMCLTRCLAPGEDVGKQWF